MSENTGSSKKRKALSATLAIAMAATMLLSGTLAFYFHTTVTNRFGDVKKAAVTHDDFIEGVNKDVYVENTGMKDIYVRVKLTEILTLDGKTVMNKPHVPTATVETCKDGTAVSSHDYFTWKMGNTDDHYFLSAKPSTKYTAQYATTGQYTLNSGVAQDFSGKTWSAGNVATDGTTGLVRFAPSCTVITMTEYLRQVEAGTILPDKFVGWVIDDTKKDDGDADDVDGNGWAYWSQRVPMNSATGLLLNNVSVNKALTGKGYDYQIKVDAEVVDDTDIGLWFGTKTTDEFGDAVSTEKASKEARSLLGYIKPITAAEIEQKITAATTAGTKGALQLYQEAKSTVNSNADLARKLVTRGDLAYETVKKAKEASSGDYDAILLSTNSGEADTITIAYAPLKQYLIKKYGGDDGNLTKDEALSVWSISTGEMNTLGLDGTNFSSFDGLTAEHFPNVCQVLLNGSKVTAAAINAIDDSTPNAGGRTMKDGIECFNLRSVALGGDIDFSAFPTLITIDMDQASGLTTLGTLPKSIQVLSFAAMTDLPQTVVDVTNLPNLILLSVPNSTTEIKGLENLIRLKNAHIGTYGRGSGMTGTLDLHNLSELQRLELDACSGITQLILPDDPYVFSNTSGRLNMYKPVGSVGLTVQKSGLTSLDIHALSVSRVQQLSLANMANLEIAIRNENQDAFAGWETATTQTKPCYECIVSADGTTATYKKYEKDASGTLSVTSVNYDDLSQTAKDQVPDALKPAP